MESSLNSLEEKIILPRDSNVLTSSTEAPNRFSNKSEETETGDVSVDILANGISSVLGPVVRDFDARVEGALKSQSLLTSSIDRLTKELDKLLEDTPIPLVAQHAAKLSGVRKRVASLLSTLRIIQGRIMSMDRMLNARDSSASSPMPSGSVEAGSSGWSQSRGLT